ncbi:MAG: hypothetical protein SF182_21745 [Deltaproteobacteria bacterium]|nr:hypothetical protein [Deltaproteobacteria bacterium]
MTDAALPSIGEAIGPLLLALPREQQPLFIALAERRAAARYREWAAAVSDADFAAALLACAGREEEIAGRVEALHPDAAAVQRALLASHPQFETLNLALFADRSLPDQFRIQANGERLGAATWRSFADAAPSAAARETFLDCAALEEESAVVLEAFGDGQ